MFALPVTGIVGSGMAAATPVYQSYTSANTVSQQSSLTINKPSGVTAGDLLIALLMRDAGYSGRGFATLSGWTSHASNFGVSGSGINTDIQYRIATGSEGASFTFSAGSWNNMQTGIIVRISGAASVSPIASTYKQDLTDAASWTCNAITAPNANCLGISFLAANQGNYSGFSFSHNTSGWTQRFNSVPTTSTAHSFGTYTVLPVSAQGLSVTRAQLSQTQVFHGYLLSIKP